MKKRITSREIAKLAKVSQSAVSRAFLPNASISPKLKGRILKIASEYGFRPNAMASSLITRHSRIIGLVMAYLDNMFYPYVLETFSRQLREKGYHVLLFLGEESGNADELFQDIMRYQVDGIVLASTVLSSNLSEQCMEYGIPVVMFNRFSQTGDCTSVVATDNFEGGRKIAHFLCAGGHEKIAYLAGLEISSTNREREGGLMRGLEENGKKLYRREVSNYNFEQAKTATRKLFGGKRSDFPDAVFAANDHVCLAVLEVLRGEIGLRVPEDVSVAGYDNVPMASLGAFELTTVEQRYQEMVNVSVQTLLEQIDNQRIVPRKIIIPGDLIVRKSARIPKNGKFKEKKHGLIWSPESAA